MYNAIFAKENLYNYIDRHEIERFLNEDNNNSIADKDRIFQLLLETAVDEVEKYVGVVDVFSPFIQRAVAYIFRYLIHQRKSEAVAESVVYAYNNVIKQLEKLRNNEISNGRESGVIMTHAHDDGYVESIPMLNFRVPIQS